MSAILVRLDADAAGRLHGALKRHRRDTPDVPDDLHHVERWADEVKNGVFTAAAIRMGTELATHAAVAIHRESKRNEIPDALEDLQWLCVEVARHGKRTNPDTRLNGCQSKPMQEWLTVQEAATMLTVSDKTIKRYVAAGKLQSNGRDGRLRRIKRVSVSLLAEGSA